MKTIQIGDYVKFRLASLDVVERVWGIVLAVNNDLVDVQKDSVDVQLDNHPVGRGYSRGDVLRGLPIALVLDHMTDKEALDREAIECHRCKAILNERSLWVMDGTAEILCEECYALDAGSTGPAT